MSAATFTQPALDDTEAVLHALASDWRPSRVESREAIRLAVIAAAADRGGLVTIAGVRRHLPAWVNPAQIGGAINKLVRGGYLVATGHTERNGDKTARNASKIMPVRRLMRVPGAEVLA